MAKIVSKSLILKELKDRIEKAQKQLQEPATIQAKAILAVQISQGLIKEVSEDMEKSLATQIVEQMTDKESIIVELNKKYPMLHISQESEGGKIRIERNEAYVNNLLSKNDKDLKEALDRGDKAAEKLMKDLNTVITGAVKTGNYFKDNLYKDFAAHSVRNGVSFSKSKVAVIDKNGNKRTIQFSRSDIREAELEAQKGEDFAIEKQAILDSNQRKIDAINERCKSIKAKVDNLKKLCQELNCLGSDDLAVAIDASLPVDIENFVDPQIVNSKDFDESMDKFYKDWEHDISKFKRNFKNAYKAYNKALGENAIAPEGTVEMQFYSHLYNTEPDPYSGKKEKVPMTADQMFGSAGVDKYAIGYLDTRQMISGTGKDRMYKARYRKFDLEEFGIGNYDRNPTENNVKVSDAEAFAKNLHNLPYSKLINQTKYYYAEDLINDYVSNMVKDCISRYGKILSFEVYQSKLKAEERKKQLDNTFLIRGDKQKAFRQYQSTTDGVNKSREKALRDLKMLYKPELDKAKAEGNTALYNELLEEFKEEVAEYDLQLMEGAIDKSNDEFKRTVQEVKQAVLKKEQELKAKMGLNVKIKQTELNTARISHYLDKYENNVKKKIQQLRKPSFSKSSYFTKNQKGSSALEVHGIKDVFSVHIKEITKTMKRSDGTVKTFTFRERITPEIYRKSVLLPIPIPVEIAKNYAERCFFGSTKAAAFFQLLVSNTPIDEEYEYTYRKTYLKTNSTRYFDEFNDKELSRMAREDGLNRILRDSRDVIKDKLKGAKLVTKTYTAIHKPDSSYVRYDWEFTYKNKTFTPKEVMNACQDEDLFTKKGDADAIEKIANYFWAQTKDSGIKNENFVYKNTNPRWELLEYGGYERDSVTVSIGKKYGFEHGVKNGWTYQAPRGYLRLIEGQWNMLIKSGVIYDSIAEFLNKGNWDVSIFKNDEFKNVIKEIAKYSPTAGTHNYDYSNFYFVDYDE